jgi:hypothetical protein
VTQFNLYKHLMQPTKKDLEDGIENSHRLVRNAMRLGVDDETHRRLVPVNPPPDLLFKKFNESSMPLSSKQSRLQKDETMEALSFGDGPGKFPGFPNATKAFWDGDGPPTEMWEVVACPVAVRSLA